MLFHIRFQWCILITTHYENWLCALLLNLHLFRAVSCHTISVLSLMRGLGINFLQGGLGSLLETGWGVWSFGKHSECSWFSSAFKRASWGGSGICLRMPPRWDIFRHVLESKAQDTMKRLKLLAGWEYFCDFPDELRRWLGRGRSWIVWLLCLQWMDCNEPIPGPITFISSSVFLLLE